VSCPSSERHSEPFGTVWERAQRHGNIVTCLLINCGREQAHLTRLEQVRSHADCWRILNVIHVLALCATIW
jgi:hypothetical protein